MTTANPAITSQLQQAIRDSSAKAADIDTHTITGDQAVSIANSKKSAVRVKEGLIGTLQSRLDSILSQLNPPPTKEVSDGKSTKTVVDEREVKKLQSEQRATESQINQARSDVNEAKDEAETATQQALAAASVSQEAQAGLQAALTTITELETKLTKGETVTAPQLQGALTAYSQASASAPENTSGALSLAFYNPATKSLRHINRMITDNPNLLVDPSANPQQGAGANAQQQAASGSASGTQGQQSNSSGSNDSSSQDQQQVITPTGGTSPGG